MARFGMTGQKLLLLAGATLFVAYLSARDALVNVLHNRLPAAALAIDPNDPVALVRDAQIRLVSGSGFSEGSTQVVGIARQSIRELPINAPAFRLYSLVSSENSDLTDVGRQMALSNRMSRRDTASQLWLIEDAVNRNDVAGALRHYDTAMRISESTRAMLYPVLTDAMEEPVIRTRFLEYMKNEPPWLESFLRHAVSNIRDPRAIALLAGQAGGFPKGNAYSSLNTELLRRLVAEGYYAEAVDHFSIIEGAELSMLTSVGLTDHSTAQSLRPVAWEPYSIEGISPVLVGSSNGQIEIESRIEPGYVGPVARKLLALPPGTYTLNAKMRADRFRESDVVGWSLGCAGGSSLLNREFSLEKEISISENFTVGKGCAVQLLTISTRTAVSTAEVTLILAHAELENRRGPDH